MNVWFPAQDPLPVDLCQFGLGLSALMAFHGRKFGDQSFRGDGPVAGSDVPVGTWNYSAAPIIARMPIRMASGNLGQASTTAAKSGGKLALRDSSAPHSAPLWTETPVFPSFLRVVRFLSSPFK